MKIAIATVVLMTLTGCASPQEREQRIVERFSAKCKALGFEEGTDQFKECRLKLYAAIAGGAAARPQ